MGRTVEALAVECGHTIHTVVEAEENPDGGALTRERLAGADVAIEFTRPTSAAANVRRLLEAGLPTVTGTTGWTGRLPEIERLVTQRGGALLYSANFSVGVQLFLKTARELARRFAGRPGFDPFILEQHHAAKLDAPSGTALRLQEAVRSQDPAHPFPITSVRAGAMPGTHTLTYDSVHETVRLEHLARSRLAFATGVLAAAEWLPGRQGLYTFEEMLFGREG